jgi:hypothetical protein
VMLGFAELEIRSSLSVANSLFWAGRKGLVGQCEDLVL